MEDASSDSLRGLSTTAVIRDSEAHMRIVESLIRDMRADYERVEALKESFRDMQTIYTYGSSWDLNEWSATMHTAKETRAVLERMLRWKYDVEHMKSPTIIGMFQVLPQPRQHADILAVMFAKRLAPLIPLLLHILSHPIPPGPGEEDENHPGSNPVHAH
jgi:hypothetical protein